MLLFCSFFEVRGAVDVYDATAALFDPEACAEFCFAPVGFLDSEILHV